MIERTGLHNRHFRTAMSFFVAALMIGSISYLGVNTYHASHAATGATLYVTPDNGSVASGSSISVTIREDSGAEEVNSVQASLNYDANKLQFVSLVEGGSFPVVAATSTGTPGVIRVGRANADAAVSGDHPVVTVNFKAIGAAGAATVSFDKAFSFLVRSSDSHDILQNVGSGSYTVTGGTVATTKPVLYINPAGGSFGQGATVSANVRLNSYNTASTTVEAAIGYPANLLQYIGVDEGGIYTTKQRTNAANGVVDVIRGIAGGGAGVQGDNPVVTINFKVIGSGTASLAIAGASAAFDASGSGQSVLNAGGSVGSSYTLTGAVPGGGTSPTPAPTPASTPPPTTGSTTTTGGNSSSVPTIVTTSSQAMTAGSQGSEGRVSLTTADDGSVVTELGGEVSLSPIIDPAIFAKNPNDTIAKAEYYLDGKLVSTQKTAPFSYKFDTTALRNGTYTMAIKTYYSSGTVDTRTDKLLVKNKVTLAYVMRHFLVNIVGVIAILAVLVALIWKLVIPRFNSKMAVAPITDHDALYGFGSKFGAPKHEAPTASDPTVVVPNDGSQVTLGMSMDVTAPIATSAAQMTEALPMTRDSISTGTHTIMPLQHDVITPSPIATPEDAPGSTPPPAPVFTPTYRPDVAAPAPVQRPHQFETTVPAPAPTQYSGDRSGAVAPPTNRFV